MPEADGRTDGRTMRRARSVSNGISACLASLALSTHLKLHGDPFARRLGYIDINSISFGGYPETELSQHNPVRE